MPDQEEVPRRVTGAYSMKPYRCNACKHEAMHGTNHWGEIYPQCRNCGTVNAMTCLEPLPEGFQMPEKWTLCRLGDIISIDEAVVGEDKTVKAVWLDGLVARQEEAHA